MAQEQRETKQGISRRAFAAGCGGAAAMLALGAVKFVPAEALVRPPGGQDEERLFARCVRCEKCIEACPHHVLKPAHIEDGIIGMRMPQMDFSNDYCTFCVDEAGGEPLCVKACPTDALALTAGVAPKDTILGKAVITQDYCLAYHLIGCRFCYDACRDVAGYDAITLDAHNRPVVNADKCNGCGACESVCVSMMEGSISAGATHRAITVRTEKDWKEVTR